MAIDADVLVIGGGMAACTAAIAAAREGATTRLVADKTSTLRHASGLIDVLGYGPDGEGPLVDPFEAMDDMPTSHPYGRVEPSTVRDALALFDDLTGDAYRGGHTDRNALVPTYGGTVKPTARYPASAAAGLASDERPALIVGLRGLTEFDGRMVADHLRAAGVPFDVDGVEVAFPADFRADARLTRYATALDRDEAVGDDGAGAREALAAVVEPHLGDAERVGFPAFLGDDRAEAVRSDLSRHLGADVFEIPAGPPSLPGLRLEDLLYDAADEAGVLLETGNPAVGYESAGGRLTAVTVDRGRREVPYGADQFVLATGGLVGKGIDSDREGVTEPLFGCHVTAPDDRYDWFDGEAFGDQPFAGFGVAVDGGMRPAGTDGRPEFPNLRAAGAVVGGGDFAAEKSMSGVSLTSGLVAGRTAAASVRS